MGKTHYHINNFYTYNCTFYWQVLMFHGLQFKVFFHLLAQLQTDSRYLWA